MLQLMEPSLLSSPLQFEEQVKQIVRSPCYPGISSVVL
ncbi:hypothetical protein V6Z11_D08G094600 [Gossypium hirsutum]